MAKKRKSPSATREPAACKTQAELAKTLGKELATIRRWSERGMPGRPGHYLPAEVRQWAEDNVKRLKWPNEEPTNKDGPVANSNSRLRLLEAQADKEEALASMAKRQDFLEDGSFVSIEEVNSFMGMFFTEFRQRLSRMSVEMSAGYGIKMRKQIRDDVDGRVEMLLRQMHNWTLRVEDLEILKASKK